MNRLVAILNCDSKYGIGKRNGLLFNQPLDMKFFRETTKGHVVAMGENTLLSFPGSKPLKNRTNIVLSQDETHNYEGVINVHSMEDFHAAIKKELEANDVFIIGGASIYKQMLPYYTEVLLTKIDADGGAEVFFENIDEDPRFILVEEGEPLLDEGRYIRFCRYRSISPESL
ncbi:MAG: dihydrofolate reductase [Candidatus Enteromonas sp.]|jgi:dihydrofolate reductase|nr:dihydrofolate reductase [Bacilli bacterium]MEE3298806.1 dihydrofolate reductase [Candidatus Enteromonas sp.]MBQ2053192.1 dihydrofolate reductase [Bacilli bacterium]MEE3426416.1 dihydrofolate reductase [Candidatus Enteromonas sp.]MEE3431913.1 dihydrofolate reductase [Candidatus Enteromonas sp.]